jgi:lysophospholipid acyltransferase (LPLAT)-like uncharacterized protein
MKEIIDRLNNSSLDGHIVDGPRGPAGGVKAGVGSIARATGAVVVPFYASANRAWYLNSWDRFLVPKPFARVTLRFDEMISFPTRETEDDFESQRFALEQTMAPHLLRAAPLG